MNIYAPNTDTPKFMSNIVTLFNQYCTSFGLLAGDFNCCFDANLDRSTFSMCNHNSSKALKLASSEVGLVDIWREFNPGTRDYTFYSRHIAYSRIDMFLLPQEYIPFVNACTIGSMLRLVHDLIYLNLSIGEGLPQHKHWRFNSSLLDNNDVCNNIKEWFKYYITDNAASDVTPAVM